MRISSKQAEQKLKDRGFMKLPSGSYFTWIQKERFEMYKSVLSFKNGAWIPHIDRLKELSLLDENYKQKDWKEYISEKIVNEQMNSLIDTDQTGKS